MREWRNGRRAGFRHQFPVSEGSTPFSRTNPPPGPSVRRFCFIPAQAAGTVEVLRDMPEDKVPEQFRAIRQELKQQPEG